MNERLPVPLVTSSPERLSGAPVFAGTRVPVKALFDYLEAGDPLEEFLTDFPNITRAHAVAVLELARRKVTDPWRPRRSRIEDVLPLDGGGCRVMS